MKSLWMFIQELRTYAGKILYVNLLGMVIVSFIESISILLLIPMIEMSGMMDQVGKTLPFSEWFAFIEEIPVAIGLAIILVIYVVIITGQNWIQKKLTIQNRTIYVGYTNHLRTKIYQSLLWADWLFFLKKRRSDLLNSLTDELNRVSVGISQFLLLATSVVFTIIQIGIALWLSPEITFFVLCCGGVLGLFSRRYIKKSEAIGNQTTEIARSYYGDISDHLNGMKEIKSNSLEHTMNKWLKGFNDRYTQERMQNANVQAQSQFFYKTSQALLVALFIYLSFNLFHSAPEELIVIVLIFSRLWPRFTAIQYSMEQIASALPAFDSLTKLLKESQSSNEAPTIQGTSVHFKGDLTCQDVSYRYQADSERYALQTINLTIPFQSTTAIVGRSGAGKSTLIDLMMGLLKADEGKINIGGIEVNEENRYLFRQNISYVPQDPFLFNGSIRDNFMLICPEAKEENLWEALEFAAAAQFVHKLPNGLDTLIGDRGVRLSGGERQRLVLARAILRKPSVLILDEATSALDQENESKIQDALDRLKGKMTIIIIAHRLSTIRNADQVLVLDAGRIVQTGRYKQLAEEKKGVFSQLLGS